MATNKPIIEREYSFSDGVLEQLADFTVSNLTRDFAQLSSRGVTQATIDNLAALREAFSNLPTDGEAQGAVGVAVEEKDAARDAAIVEARRLRTAAQNIFGEHSAIYRSFGFTNMDKLREDTLARQMRRMHREGTDAQAQLASEGITTIFLDAFLVAIDLFDDKLDDVDNAEADRDKLTEERHISGNTLYKEIVRLCNIGKDVFATISEATYNDYVIENYVGSSSFPANSIEVKGRVTINGTNDPVVGALVTVGKIGQPEPQQVNTDSDGRFKIRGNNLNSSDEGTVMLTVNAPGFQYFQEQFDVELGKIYDREIALEMGMLKAA